MCSTLVSIFRCFCFVFLTLFDFTLSYFVSSHYNQRLVGLLPPPPHLRLIGVSSKSVTVEWETVAGALSYEVEIAEVERDVSGGESEAAEERGLSSLGPTVSAGELVEKGPAAAACMLEDASLEASYFSSEQGAYADVSYSSLEQGAYADVSHSSSLEQGGCADAYSAYAVLSDHGNGYGAYPSVGYEVFLEYCSIWS